MLYVKLKSIKNKLFNVNFHNSHQLWRYRSVKALHRYKGWPGQKGGNWSHRTNKGYQSDATVAGSARIKHLPLEGNYGRFWQWLKGMEQSKQNQASSWVWSNKWLGGKTRMDVRYTLTLQDHLAWYDHFLAMPDGVRFRSSFPLIGRFRRRRYSRQVALPPSRYALGERTLEATEQGIREFSPEFSFTTAWPDLGLVAVTPSHLFLAHTSMNAHIVPLRYFRSDAEREAFISFAKSHVHKIAA